MEIEAYLLVAFGAFLVGLAKGGLPGIGNLTIVIFAMVFDPKQSVGILLPVLISADTVAIIVYRKHVEWIYVRRVLPWMMVGIVIGTISFSHMSSEVVAKSIGIIVLGMTGLQVFRSWYQKRYPDGLADKIPHSLGFRASLGIIGGFATMVANAAGPVAQLYFLSVGLPKLAFIGTGVWCFFIVNLIKVPLQMGIGIIGFESITTSLSLIPFSIAGALISPHIVRFIPQKQFTALVWFFIVIAGLKLFF